MKATKQQDVTGGVIAYTIPKEPRQWQSLILAALVHAALLAALWWGAQQDSDNAVATVAENSGAKHPALVVAKEVSGQEQQAEPIAPTKAKVLPVATAQLEPQPGNTYPAPPAASFKRQQQQSVTENSPTEAARVAQIKRKERDLVGLKQKDAKQKEANQKIAKQKLALAAIREQENNQLLAKKIALAENKERAAAWARKSAEQSKKAAAEKQRLQELADAKQAEQFRAAEMRRITGAGSDADTHRPTSKARQVLGGSGPI